MTISPEFSAMSTAVSIVLVAYLLIGEPLTGKWFYDRLVQRRETDPRALTRFYRFIIVVGWALALVVFLILLMSPGIDAQDFGLVLPDTGGFLSGSVVAGMIVGLGICALALVVLRKKLPEVKRAPANLDHIEALLPATPAERRLSALVSVTAGVTEEVVYRGFLIAFGVGVVGLNVYVAAVLTILVFGFAHLYQGVRGMVGVTLAAVIFTGVYLGTGSLLVSMILHTLIDLNSLLWLPKSLEKQSATASS